MKYVTFISGLKIEKVPHFGRDELDYHLLIHCTRTDDGAVLGMSKEMPLDTRTVPITELCGLGRDDVYIAYSEEVEKLLGIPIRTLVADLVTRKRLISEFIEEKRRIYIESHYAQSQLRLLRTANLWQRIKFVFTRTVPK